MAVPFIMRSFYKLSKFMKVAHLVVRRLGGPCGRSETCEESSLALAGNRTLSLQSVALRCTVRVIPTKYFCHFVD
jgi:hypothetical protein